VGLRNQTLPTFAANSPPKYVQSVREEQDGSGKQTAQHTAFQNIEERLAKEGREGGEGREGREGREGEGREGGEGEHEWIVDEPGRPGDLLNAEGLGGVPAESEAVDWTVVLGQGGSAEGGRG
jgi:hypothetical protein